VGAFVALVMVHLHFADVHDLKAKRKQVKSVSEQLRARLHVSVAEVDHQDKWQRATLAVAAVSGTAGGAEGMADRIERFVEARVPDGVRFQRGLTTFDEVSGIG
jgi:uncharacterized protein